MNTWSILLAAGQSSRLQELKEKKQFLNWKDRPLFWHAAKNIAGVAEIQGIVFVFPAEEILEREKQLSELTAQAPLGTNVEITSGGSLRRESAFKALQVLPRNCESVIIHDAGRPFASPELFQNIIDQLKKGEEAVVPGVPATETIKQKQKQGLFTLPREEIYLIQTPQGFRNATIQNVHQKARELDLRCTDDSYLVEYFGGKVSLILGEESNRKITNYRDLDLLEEKTALRYVQGLGYDVHKYGQSSPMKLGGIPITDGPQVVAHSDGDVLLHAVIDAILGCLGKGDLGDHFPDTDPGFENINSSVLLAEVLKMAQKESLVLDHLDVTLICQIPKLSHWKAQIKDNLANLLGLPPDRVNIKSTTEEGLGFTGELKGIKAFAMLSAHI